APARKAELGKQRKAWMIVAEDETEEGVDLEAWRFGDRLRQEIRAKPFLPGPFIDIDAQLGSLAVCGPAIEVGITQPHDHPSIGFDLSLRSWCGYVFLDPVDAAFNRYRLGVGGDHARWNRRVVDCDDLRQVRGLRQSMTDRHSNSVKRLRSWP